MDIILRDYQQNLVNKINQSQTKRNCVQLSTGGGKTIIFSYLANNYEGNVLILVNRTELLEQTAKNITRPKSLITAKTKKIGEGEVKIGMVESVHNRIKSGVFNLNNIDLIIVDEIQNLQFVKVFENYENRLLGFTATPVINKKESYYKCRYCEKKTDEQVDCCGRQTQKYNLRITLKKWYGNLITGIPISDLIEREYLTPVHNLACTSADLSKLVTDSSGEFTNKSQNEVFNTVTNTKNLLANYEEHCKEKKTMVFNTNIAANNEAEKMFRMNGYNVRSYDSKSKENRKEVVDWFRNTPDGVLMSVGVFTTGFDVEDVECIILNKATQSLSLYHQIVGRGGRITDKILKPYFKLVDLGGNLPRFGSWSDKVDWVKIYNDESERKAKIQDLDDFFLCHSCDSLITEYDCEVCGAEEPPKKESRDRVMIAKSVNKMPKPTGKQVVSYAERKEMDVNEAKRFVANYIVDMFITAKTSREAVIKNKHYLTGGVKDILRPIYFAIHGSNLKGNRKRTIKDFENKVFKKLNQYYENRG